MALLETLRREVAYRLIPKAGSGGGQLVGAPASRASTATPSFFGNWLFNLGAFSDARTNLERAVGTAYTCIDIRGNVLGTLPWKAYKATAQQGGREELGADAWIVQTMLRPNVALPHMTWGQIIRNIEFWQCIAGRAVIWARPTKPNGKPVQWWMLPPSLVQMEIGSNPGEWYRFYTPGGYMRIPGKEVIYLPLVTPSDDLVQYWYGGRARMDMIIDDLDVNYFQRKYLRDAFKHRGMPPMFLETEKEVREQDREIFLQDFLEQYQGNDGNPRPLYLPSRTKAVVLDTLLNQKGMQELVQGTSKQVAAGFQVSMALLTGEFQSEAPAASFRALRYVLYENTLKFPAQQNAQVLTAWLQQWEPGWVIDHEPMEWQDPIEVRADELHRLDNGLASIDDIRKERGAKPLGPAKGGDAVLFRGQPLGLVIDPPKPEPTAIQQPAPATQPASDPSAGAQEDVAAEEPQSDTAKLLNGSAAVNGHANGRPKNGAHRNGHTVNGNGVAHKPAAGQPFKIAIPGPGESWRDTLRSAQEKPTEPAAEAVRVAYWKLYDDKRAEYSDLLKREVQKTLRAIEREVLSGIESGKALRRRGEPFNEEAAADDFATRTEEDRKTLVDWTFRQAFGDVSADADGYETDYEKNVKAAVAKSAALVREPARTIKAEVSALLTEMKDRPADEIAEAIRARFKDYSQSRADLIAQTTAAVTINVSQREAWSGLGIKRKWLTRRDKRVRGAHQIDGQLEDDEGMFTLTDGRTVEYPQDPRERCIQMPDVMGTNPQAGKMYQREGVMV